MANSNDLYKTLISKFASQLKAAIKQSIAQDEIVRVTLDADDIEMVANVARDEAANVDYVRENDDSFDLWAWEDGMTESEMSWRLNVTLNAAQ